MKRSTKLLPTISETKKRGSVKVITQVIPSNKRMRTIMASAKPMLRVFARCSMGSLLETMEMKMMLSMPSTTSKKVSVTRASHASAVKKISMVEREMGLVWGTKIEEEIEHSNSTCPESRCQHLVGSALNIQVPA